MISAHGKGKGKSDKEKGQVQRESLDVEVRAMQHADIEAGMRLCRLAGWDQVHRDWRRFLDGPDSSVRAAIHGTDVIATIATIRYGTQFGWIGMVLVDPAAQGRGIGSVMVREAVDSLGDMASVRLDATPAGRIVYLKHDFVDECTLTRMEAISVKVDHPPRAIVRAMTRGELPAVVAMDRSVFGAPRSNLLEWMYDGAPEFAFVAERHGNLCGYLFGRHGLQYEHLGPLVTDDLSVAMTLTKACLARHRDQAFVIDTPDDNESWIRFLENSGFRPQRPYVRMYRGRPGPFGLVRHQFAVLGPEFG
jgi:GNAT superfamily N-acetyltransferase